MDEDVVGVSEWVAVLKRRWLLVAVWVLVIGAIAVGLSLTQSPTYEASAEVLLSPAPSTQQGEPTLEPEEIATQIEVITSEPVALAVLKDVAIDGSVKDLRENVTVEQTGESRAVVITASARTPELAAEVANSYVDNYLEHRRESIFRSAQARRTALLQQMQEIRRELARVERELAARPGPRRRDELTSERGSLLIQISQAQTGLGSVVVPSPEDGGTPLSTAQPPRAPATPSTVRAGGLGAVLGLLLGVALAFVRHRRDDVIYDESTLRKALPDVQVLGRLPHSRVPDGELVTISRPHDPADEAYRALASNIRFPLPGQRKSATDQQPMSSVAPDGNSAAGSVLLVTSAGAEEGKTTVAANVAVAAARFGLHVILVDGDLRGAKVAGLFGHKASPGLSDLALFGGDPEEALIHVGPAGLALLPAGSPAPNPAELLASAGTRRVLDALAAKADLVVIDTGPVGVVADTLELMRSADAPVLFVVRRGRTRGNALGDAVETTRQTGGRILGVVFTDLDHLARGTYGHTRPREHSPSPEATGETLMQQERSD